MSGKGERRKPRRDDERAALPDEGKGQTNAAEEQKTVLRSLDELALETQRRSIAYGRARGVA